MSLPKDCADHLRARYRLLTGRKLGSSHAHELVAAFFGYKTAAALRAETRFPLNDIGKAEILIPDLRLMDERVGTLRGLPADLPSVDDLTSDLCHFLASQGHFDGRFWSSRHLSDDVNAFVQHDPMMIEGALDGEIASTNAYFDELYIEEYDFKPSDDALVATLTGSLNGENDQDRAFHGDKIVFTTVMTFERVAGRIAYMEPELETDGKVDDAMYYDEDFA